jgi:TatD DNase family protein
VDAVPAASVSLRFFDSHAHLEGPRFDADREEVIARAQSFGVTRILTCGSDLETSRASLSLAQMHSGLWAAVGIHGHAASKAIHGEYGGRWDLDEACFAQLEEVASDRRVVAIGEIGLDYHYDFSPREVQRAILRRQLLLARTLNLPVILHDREADEDLRTLFDEVNTLRGGALLRGVLHCFLSDGAMATWAISRGLYIGIAGPLTFRNQPQKGGISLASLVRQLPLECLLIETDSPYLAPQPVRGQRNEPAFVSLVADKLAQVMGLPLATVAQRTTDNACHLFGVA